jgi:hypothetical protein
MRSRTTKSPAAILLTTATVLLAAAGCEEERHATAPAGASSKNAVAHGPAAPPKPEFIVGKRTQEIVKIGPALPKGEKVSENKITAKDYITLQGNAYVTIIGKTSVMMIDQAVNLYKAEHDRYPKDHEEFMADIIKANNISLPKLPYYQKYGYDAEEHKLKVLENEDLKNQPLGQ